MNTTVYYCESWFFADRHLLGPYDVKKAKKSHEKNKNYTILVDSDVRPSSVITLACRTKIHSVFVAFMDHHLRDHISYGYIEYDPDNKPGKLYLSSWVKRYYIRDSEPIDVTAYGIDHAIGYYFKRDKSLLVKRTKLRPHSEERTYSTFDDSDNYVDYPAFGEYDDFLRERIELGLPGKIPEGFDAMPWPSRNTTES